MRTTRLGASDIMVSAMCLGCMEFGTRINKEASFAVLDAYYEQGGRFLDTSNNYAFWAEGGHGGESETLLGEWLKARRNRQQLVIATKFGAQPTIPGGGFETAEGLGKEAMTRAIEGSLGRLGIDCVDLYYCHVEDPEVPAEETLGAFDHLRNQGKIREIGCSNHGLRRLDEARRVSRANDWPVYQALQQRYSILQPKKDVDFGPQRLVTSQIKDYVQASGDISLIAYGVLRVGVVPGVPLAPEYDTAENKAALQTIADIATQHDRTVNEVALSWMMNTRPIAVPLISTRSVVRLKENLRAMTLELDDGAMKTLDSLAQAV